MNYLAYITVQLATKSYSQSFGEPIRVEAGSAATAAHRALMVASKHDMVKRKRVAYWQVKVVPCV